MTGLLPARTSGAEMIGAWRVNSVNCVDALTLLAGLPDNSVDMILTDPPYGLAGRVFEIDRSFRGSDYRKGNYTAINEEWDYIAPIDWMQSCERVTKLGGSVICFGGRQSIYRFASEGIRLGWKLINDITLIKPDPPPNFTGRMMTESTERLLWFCPSGKNWTYNLAQAKNSNYGKNITDVWRFRPPHDNRLHPAQKPISTIEKVIALISNENHIILDPFAGSGTTAVAARNLGRRYITGDISPEYCATAERRLAQPYTLMFAEMTG